MLKRISLFAALGALILLGLYLFVAFRWSYSSGERAGWVQKFSNKGWVCKTWEGELAMVSLPGSIPEKFYFTVRDDAVAAQINTVVGQRVRLHYEQHRGVPGSCFGETEYWVDAVSVLPDSATPAAGVQIPPAASPVSP